MSSGKQRAVDDYVEDDNQYEQGDEEFITEDDVLEEVQDHGDAPMDDEEDEDRDEHDVGEGSSGPIDDNSVQHFTGHTASAFTVACHPTEPLAASGGEDDVGYVWDITDGEVIVKLTGHTDSVSCIGFSTDGEMVSTGGMDGKIRIWRRVGKEHYRNWEFLTELQGPDEVNVRDTFSNRSSSIKNKLCQ